MEFLAFLGMLSAIGLGIYMLIKSAQSLNAQRIGIKTATESINQTNELMEQNKKIIKLSEINIQLKKASMMQEKEHIETLKQMDKKLEKILGSGLIN